MREVIDLTKDLIRFKSMHSHPQEIMRCMDFIQSYLEGIPIRYRRLDQAGSPVILVAPEHKKVPLLLMSHIDVVYGPDDLFEPVEKDGKLYGRGSIDDKYAAALSLVLLKNQALKVFKTGGTQDDLSFGVLITGDEEVGGYKGAGRALSQVNTDYCIALDGGQVEKIVIKEKGILKVKLTAKGKAAHGSRPWLGDNAIEKLIDDYQRIQPLFKQETEDHWHRTLNFSIINAGRSFNQVPDMAEAVFDIRYTEDDDPSELIDSIRKEIQGELTVEANEPVFFGGKSPYLDLLLDIAEDSLVGFEHGASDARFLPQFGIKGIVWGADGDLSQHALDEHVNIESISKLYGLLEEFVEKL